VVLATSRHGAVARRFAGVGSYFADDVVWQAPDVLAAGGVIRGRDAVVER
jgi:hypothetical protein